MKMLNYKQGILPKHLDNVVNSSSFPLSPFPLPQTSARNLLLLASCLLVSTSWCPVKVEAQISSDGTVSTEVNTTDFLNFLIENGDRIGDNLFHSFLEFSVPTNGSAFFDNAEDIANIFSRVTGGSISEIDGLIGANGVANLFLLNPAGIIFGPNAALDIGGSFLATTADSFVFEDGVEFSAVNPQAPSLLTVNIPIGLRFRDNPGDIVNQSRVPDTNGDAAGLQVQNGNSLTLIGGNVEFQSGIATAPGGRIELGGLTEAGTVELNRDFSLVFPETVTRGDVSLANLSFANVAAGDGGSISVNARNFNISGGGGLTTGILSGLGTPESQAGDIVIDATESVTVQGELFSGTTILIFSFTGELDTLVPALTLGDVSNLASPGNAGNVIINTERFEGIGSFLIGSLTNGEGNAGNLIINAGETVSLDGIDGLVGLVSGFYSVAGSSATGSGADIIINTPSFSMSNLTQIATSTSGVSNAGDITINVSESVSINSGAILQAATLGAGNAGNITIQGLDGKLPTVSLDAVGVLELDNVSIPFNNASRISTDVGALTELTNDRQGGSISIIAESLSITNGGNISSSTSGQGNAGSVNLEVRDRLVLDGANVLFNFNVLLNALTGQQLPVEQSSIVSSITSNVESGAIGEGGEVNITANSLSITNGAQIQTAVRQGFLDISGNLVFTQGNAGKVNIEVEDEIIIDGVSEILNVNGVDTSFASLISSSTEFGSIADAGEVKVSAESISITNGGNISSSTLGQGNAGDVNLEIRDRIALDGVNVLRLSESGEELLIVSGINSNVDSSAIGDGGKVNITANSLSITNGAQINAATFGEGNAGSVIVRADEIELVGVTPNGQFSSGIFSTSQSTTGDGGSIEVSTRLLNISEGAVINASTFGEGNAGSVIVTADEIELVGVTPNGQFFSGIFSTANESTTGEGGSIEVSTRVLNISEGAEISASTSGEGDAGSVIVTADEIKLIGTTPNGQFPSGIFSVSSGATGENGNIELSRGDSGNVEVSTRILNISEGAIISASTFNSSGNAGNVEVTADEIELIGTTSQSSFGGGIFSIIREGSTGEGGNVEVTTKFLSISEDAEITASNLGVGDAGNLEIVATGDVTVESGAAITVSSENGQAGSLSINADNIFLDQGNITATTAVTNTDEQGANIDLEVDGLLFLENESLISATASEDATGGNIDINAGFIVAFPNENSDIIANAFRGQGGLIEITADGIFGLEIRDQLTDESDITAFSELDPSLNGQVIFNDPEVDPSQGLIKLPEEVVDQAQLVAQNACQLGSGSQFASTGRGGLPPNPNDAINSDTVRIDLVQPVPSTTNSNQGQLPTTPTSDDIVPAQGWIFTDQGQVLLVGYNPNDPESKPIAQRKNNCVSSQ